MVNFHVTYLMNNKEDRDNYYKEVAAKGIIDKSRAEDGCYRYEFYFPADSDTSLFLWEQWETREHQATHCKTSHFAEMGELKTKYNVETSIDIVD